MKIWRKLVALLALICLVINAAPAVLAADDADRRGLDYSALERQIGIANGLNSYDYTKESWKKLQSAVEIGNKRLEGVYDQAKLDQAAQDIAQAIKDLVKMDYSPLTKALDAVYAKMDENPEYHDVWYRLDKAVDKARPLLISGDQEAVNAMAENLNLLMAELIACSEKLAEPEIVIQEVEVEVPPTDDFCNISTHFLWQLLLTGSVLINVALIAGICFVMRQKKNAVDNTPLVSYDIDDDDDDLEA